MLRALVTERHWRKQETFRAQFENAAKELAEQEGEPRLRSLSVSERQLQRWLSGQLRTQPFPDQCRVLEHMFGHPISTLLGPASDHAPGPRLAEGTGLPPGVVEVASNADDHLVELEEQITMAARRALRFGVIAEGTNVGPEMLDQLRDEVRRLATAYPREALPTLLGDLVELQDVVFRVLEGRQRPNQTRELYLVAGVTCGMLAKASHDLGNPQAAMSQARTAYVCADNAGHDGLRGWLRGLQSMIAYWAGWSNDALRYAQLGSNAVAGARGTVSVWLPALEARAWAAMNDTNATVAAIERAAAARDEVADDELDALGGILTFPRPRQLYYAADAMAWLADAQEEAEIAAAAAVQAYDDAGPTDWAFSDDAGSRCDLALTRLGRGEVEGAHQALAPVLELPPDQRINGIVSSVHRVHTALRDPVSQGSQLAGDLQEEIEAFSRAPLAALPR